MAIVLFLCHSFADEKNPNSSAHLYCTSSSAFASSPPCGSCSVFEVAHTMYKNAMNECSFGCGCPTRVIPRERSDRGNLAVRRTPNKHIPCISTPRSTHALRAYHCTKCNITAVAISYALLKARRKNFLPS